MDIMEQAQELTRQATNVEYHLHADNHLAAPRSLNLAAETFSGLAAGIAQAAYNGGFPKKAIAAALGVTPRTLRGMERQVA